jgi:hypothetical protein
LQRIPGRLLAVGIRPEHILTPDVLSSSYPAVAARP